MMRLFRILKRCLRTGVFIQDIVMRIDTTTSVRNKDIFHSKGAPTILQQMMGGRTLPLIIGLER